MAVEKQQQRQQRAAHMLLRTATTAALALLLLATQAPRRAAAADVISASRLESCILDGGAVRSSGRRRHRPPPLHSRCVSPLFVFCTKPSTQRTKLAATHAPTCSPRATTKQTKLLKGAAPQLSCAQKLVVTLSVDSGDTAATSSLELPIACVGAGGAGAGGSCPCRCDFAADAACQCRDLAAPLRVNVTKTPLWASYPLTYLQSFNWKPTEGIVRPGSGRCKVSACRLLIGGRWLFVGGGFCIHLALLQSASIPKKEQNSAPPSLPQNNHQNQKKDGDFDEDVTCGWYYLGGVKAPDSQGFACECSSAAIWDDTFGTNKQRTCVLFILFGRCFCLRAVAQDKQQKGPSLPAYTLYPFAQTPQQTKNTAALTSTATFSATFGTLRPAATRAARTASSTTASGRGCAE
jgi:hypothetical protein